MYFGMYVSTYVEERGQLVGRITSLSFNLVCPESQSQVISLGSKYFFSLSLLTGLVLLFQTLQKKFNIKQENRKQPLTTGKLQPNSFKYFGFCPHFPSLNWPYLLSSAMLFS